MGFTRDFSYRYIYNHIYLYRYTYVYIDMLLDGTRAIYKKIHLSHVDVNPSVKMVVPKNGVHPPKWRRE